MTAAMATLFASCSSDNATGEAPSPLRTHVLTATVGQSETRTSLGEDGKSIYWSENDVLKVFSASAAVEYTLSDGAGTKTGTFSTTSAPEGFEPTAAVYPASANPAISGTKLTMTLPTEYAYTAGMANVPLYGAVSEGSIQFKNLVGMFQIKYEKVPEKASKLVITADKAIAGDVSTTVSTAKLAPVSTGTTSKTYTITGITGGTENALFYVPLLAQTYTSIKMVLQDDEGNNVAGTAIEWLNKTVAVGKIYTTTLKANDVTVVTEAESLSAVETAIAAAVNSGTAGNTVEIVIENCPATSSSDADIVVPTTNSSSDAVDVVLDFATAPTTSSQKLTIKTDKAEASVGESTQELTVVMPEESSAEVEIIAPTSTVTLEGTYEKVEATTAQNTLIVANGAKVAELTVNGGNVVLNGGAVTKLTNAASGTSIACGSVASTISELSTTSDLNLAASAAGKTLTVTKLDLAGGKLDIAASNVSVKELNQTGGEVVVNGTLSLLNYTAGTITNKKTITKLNNKSGEALNFEYESGSPCKIGSLEEGSNTVSVAYKVGTASDLAKITTSYGTFILQNDIDYTSNLSYGIIANADGVLDLNGHNLTFTSTTQTTTIYLRGSSKLTIKGSGMVKNNSANAPLLWTANEKTSLTIEGGEFETPNVQVAYAYAGNIEISGGTFKSTSSDLRYVLNCLDANRTNKDMNQNTGTAKILVTGGKYYQFDPANCAAEGTGTNFVKTGYKSTASGDYYEVTAE